MRKIIFFIAILCLSGKVLAQFNYGAKAGVNISNFGITDNSPYVGFNAGVYAEYFLPSSFGLSAGVDFSQKGSSFIPSRTKDSNEPSAMQTRLNYLDIPITVLYKINLDSDIHLLLKAGGYYALGISGKSTLFDNDIQLSNNDPFGGFELELEDGRKWQFKTFDSSDYGCVLGVGVAYKHVRMGIDYKLGLKNITDGISIVNGNTPRNRVWGISVGYTFKTL